MKRRRRSIPAAVRIVGWLNLVAALAFALFILFGPMPSRWILASAFMLTVAGVWGILALGLIQGRRWAVVMLVALLPLTAIRLVSLVGDGDATVFSVIAFLLHAGAATVGLVRWRGLPRAEGSWLPQHADAHPFEHLNEPGEVPASEPRYATTPPPLPPVAPGQIVDPATLWAIDTPVNRAVAERVVGRKIGLAGSGAWIDAGLLPVLEHRGEDTFARGVSPLTTLAAALDEAREADAESRLALLAPHFLAICATLRVAHTHGVVLRHLRLDRIAVTLDEQIVIRDWSTALLGKPLTISAWGDRLEAWRSLEDLRVGHDEFGTPFLIAPELLEDASGVVGPRTDVYALGALLHLLLTGWPPYEAQSLPELTAKARGGPPPSPPGVPEVLAALCVRCLSPDPESRPTDATVVARVVRTWLQPAETHPAETHPRETPPPPAPAASPPSDREIIAERHRLALRQREVAQHAREAEARARRRVPKAVALAAVLAAAVGFGISLLVLPRGGARVAPEEAAAKLPPRDEAAQVLWHYGELGRREFLAGRREAAIPYLLAEYGLENESPALRYLLARACLPLGEGHFALRGHEEDIEAVAVDPGGRYLATVSRDGTARLWDARDGALVRPLTGSAGPVHDVCFDLEGLRVATASADGTVRVWDAVSGTPGVELEGHEGAVLGVAFSPGGTRLLSVGADGTLRAWNAQDGRHLTKLEAHEGAASLLCVSPTGSRVATSGADGRVTLRNAGSGDRVTLLDDQRGWAFSLSFSADGRLLAASGTDGTVRLWNAATGGSPRVIEGHDDAVTDVRFHPSGRRLATASADGTARIWDATSLAELHRLEDHQGVVLAVAWSPDGSLLLTASEDGAAKVWDGGTGILLDSLALSNGPLRDAHFTPEGARAVVTGARGAAYLIDTHLERRTYGALRAWAAECIPWSLERGELNFTELRIDRKRAQRAGRGREFGVVESSARRPRSPPSRHLDAKVGLLAPPMVAVGETFEATLVAWNSGEVALSEVIMAVRGGQGLRLLGRGTSKMTIPILEPGVRETLRVVFVADEVGAYRIDASMREGRGWAAAGAIAEVLVLTREDLDDTRMDAVDPLLIDMDLTLTVDARRQQVGVPFAAVAQATNTGTLPIHEVVLALRGGEGLAPVGDEEPTLTLDRLLPGDTREITVHFVAERGGSLRIDASARTTRGWAAAGAFCPVEVAGLSALQMELVDLSLDDRRKGIFEEGEEFRYLVEVANDQGSEPTEEIYVLFQLPPELTFVSGAFAGDDDRVVAERGPYVQSEPFTLALMERQRISIVVRATTIPDGNLVKASAAVMSSGGGVLSEETESTTLVPPSGGRRVPAYELEMKDVALDAGEKGVFERRESFLYVVAVRNDGSDVVTPNLRVSFTLPPELEFVSGRGDRGVEIEGTGDRATSTPFSVARGQVQHLEIVVTCVDVSPTGFVQAGVVLKDADSGDEYASETESTTLRLRAPLPR